MTVSPFGPALHLPTHLRDLGGEHRRFQEASAQALINRGRDITTTLGAGNVVALTERVRGIIESRHRPGARYRVENLSAILDTAKSISLILTIVLLLVAAQWEDLSPAARFSMVLAMVGAFHVAGYFARSGGQGKHKTRNDAVTTTNGHQ